MQGHPSVDIQARRNQKYFHDNLRSANSDVPNRKK